MITIFTSLRPGYPVRFPINVAKADGIEIAEIGIEVPEDKGLTEWMLECWRTLNPDDGDVVIFKHNDLLLYDPKTSLAQIQAAISSGCDVVGVAGTESFDPHQRLPNGRYPLWTQCTPTTGRRGMVFHKTDIGQGWSLYGAPGSVKVIDGCLMACSGRLAPRIEEFLTPKFHRHYYDIAFSYNVHRVGGIVYVLCLPVLHLSVGRFDGLWEVEAERFYRIYDGVEDPDRGGVAEESERRRQETV